MLKKYIGVELRQARKAAGLTQREVAERSNISRENYARIERGAASTTLDTLERILKALDLCVRLLPR